MPSCLGRVIAISNPKIDVVRTLVVILLSPAKAVNEQAIFVLSRSMFAYALAVMAQASAMVCIYTSHVTQG